MRSSIRRGIVVGTTALAVLLSQVAAFGKGSIVNSPHNLSASGGLGKHAISFSKEERICVFCHAPHNTAPSLPLWNHGLPPESTPYKMYGSSTFDVTVSAKPDRPTGSSRLCLACHDGTIALNSYGSVNNSGAPVFMPSDPDPTRNANLTTDLSNSHPISFIYSNEVAVKGELKPPAALPPQIKLDQAGMLQCNSCHDAHNNEFGNFLVVDNSASGSPLCTACHNKVGWADATHNPAQSSGLATGCMTCHYAHSAPGPIRLLHAKKDVDNCITATCHGNGATPLNTNVQQLFAAPYRHPVGSTVGVHDENETLPAQTFHVECVDCHNPHQANRIGAPLSVIANPAANPPLVDGLLAGVKGVDKDTLTVITARSEYEVCFKCHAGGSAGNFCSVTETPPNRVIPDPDQKHRFDRNRTSSAHPVTSARLGSGQSLLSELQARMVQIYCCDCHNSDQSTMAGGSAMAGGSGPSGPQLGPNGPHGSRYEHILMDRYDMPQPLQTPPTTWTPADDFLNRYALCFRCHWDTFVMGSGSGFSLQGVSEHTAHVQQRGIPCFACHDPHGVPQQGSSTNSHLVNFSKSWAASAGLPNPTYTSNPDGSHSCTVSCHNAGSPNPNTETYGGATLQKRPARSPYR